MVVRLVSCPFVALMHFLTLNDCVHWLIIDLSDAVADGSICMAVSHDCIDPVLGKINKMLKIIK